VARLRVTAIVTAAISIGLVLALPAADAQAAMPRPGTIHPVTFTMPRAARQPVRPVLVPPVHVPPVPGRPVPDRPVPGRPSGPLGACEQKLLDTASQHGVPRLVIVGASFTAGTGPGEAAKSWAVLLARQLHWDAVVYGVPGAGYVRPGVGRRGPVGAELGRIALRDLAPALVIVQAGHDDMGVPAPLERERVRQAIELIRAEAPQARIALVTVFPGKRRTAAAARTDQDIIAAARAADPGVIIMDPLAQDWTYPRTRDGLHPTAAGDASIARTVAGILSQHGIGPVPLGRAGPVICDSGIPAGPRVPARPVVPAR